MGLAPRNKLLIAFGGMQNKQCASPARRAWLIGLLAALMVFGSACGCDKARGAAPLAVVEGHPVTLAEFRTQSAFMGLGDDPKGLTPELRRSVLESLVRSILVARQAEKLGIKISPKEVDLKERLLRRGLSEKDFQASLAEQSLSYEKWRAMLADELLAEKTMDLVLASRSGVSAEEVKSYYLAHPEQFERTAQVLAQHAVLPDKKTAKKLIDLLGKGQEMGAAAASLGFPLAEGGHPTWLSMGHMPKGLEKKIFALKPGKVAGPFASDYGMHVIRVLDKKPAGKVPLSEAAANIQKRLAADKKLSLAEQWLGQLRQNAKVTLNDDFIKTGESTNQGS